MLGSKKDNIEKCFTLSVYVYKKLYKNLFQTFRLNTASLILQLKKFHWDGLCSAEMYGIKCKVFIYIIHL